MEEIKFEVVKRLLEKGIDVKLPERSTSCSAGYDFYLPEDAFISSEGVTYVPTGIKAKFPQDMFLMLCNRSSNPKKKEVVLINGVGIVDSDYYNNEDNEGEICFAFKSLNDSGSGFKKGDKLGQGIFIKYATTTNDNAEGKRTGGFGSTGK